MAPSTVLGTALGSGPSRLDRSRVAMWAMWASTNQGYTAMISMDLPYMSSVLVGWSVSRQEVDVFLLSPRSAGSVTSYNNRWQQGFISVAHLCSTLSRVYPCGRPVDLKQYQGFIIGFTYLLDQWFLDFLTMKTVQPRVYIHIISTHTHIIPISLPCTVGNIMLYQYSIVSSWNPHFIVQQKSPSRYYSYSQVSMVNIPIRPCGPGLCVVNCVSDDKACESLIKRLDNSPLTWES